jgi:hypothetical protein
MAKYISLKFEPAVGTPFDYLINVEGLYYDAQRFYDENGISHNIPFDIPPYTVRLLMNGYIQGLISDALQRPGNKSFVPATDGPLVITEFAP